jgi:PAS domain S-box-containing protein
MNGWKNLTGRFIGSERPEGGGPLSPPSGERTSGANLIQIRLTADKPPKTASRLLLLWRPRLERLKTTTPSDRDSDYREVLAQFLDLIFPYALVFGFVAVAVSFYRSWTHGWYLTLTWHVTMYTAGIVVTALRRRLPITSVVSFLLCLLSLDVIQSFLTIGLASFGFVSLTVVCMLAGMFIGVRTGIAFVGGGVIASTLIGVGTVNGIISPIGEVAAYLRSPAAWFLHSACFVLYTVPVIVTTDALRQRMNKTVSKLEKTNRLLQEEVAMRKRAEGDFKLSEDRYRRIVERAKEGMFIVRDGIFVSVNAALARLAGYDSPDDMVRILNDHNGRLYATAEDKAIAERVLGRLSPPDNVELQIKKTDGNVLWVRVTARAVCDDNGNPLYHEGTVDDITERKRAEIALQDSEAKYRTVVENSLVASFIIQDGFFCFVNTTFCSVTGFSRRELVDHMRLEDIIHPDHRKRWKDIMESASSGQSAKLEIETKILTRHRNPVSVKVLAGLTTYNDRLAVFGTFIDITKERNLEAQLRQAQKMEAIGTLAGGIAHDFNNILTALTGYATLLQMRLEAGDPSGHYVDQILSASQKATSLTQNLLTFGRRQPISLKPVDLGSIVKGTENLLRRLLTEDIALTTTLSDDAAVVMADPTQIDQILFNLVTNARDAMPKGGELAICTGRIVLDRDFVDSKGFGEVGEYGLLSVSDNGTGMDELTKERIFDPFYTTKEMGRGTGLGLSTVYGIVQQHEGYIVVDSEASKGSTFSIYLPLVKRASEEIRPSMPIVVRSVKGLSEAILVADDNNEVRKFVSDMLDHCGYRVIQATDGADAVERFKTNEDISLVILDSVMPKQNGRQAFDAMKALRPSLKVLFMSGYTKDVVLDRGIAEGEFDFVEKPLSPTLFVRKIEEIMAR